MSLGQEEDEQLMLRVAEGDERAFRELADRHVDRVLRLAQRLLGGSAEADDVAQETLIRIWKHAARWRHERSRLGTWIYTITYRLCVDRLRRARPDSSQMPEEFADPAPGPLEAATLDDDVRRVRRALRSLDTRQRAAVTLFYYEDLDGQEAAAVLGISLRAYWSLLHRARQNLQQALNLSSTRSEVAGP